METELKELLNERKIASNGVNYWRHAIERWKDQVPKYGQDDIRRQMAMKQIAFCELKLAQDIPRLEQLSQRIKEIDPIGSMNRQKNSLRSNISHRRHELQTLRQIAGQEPADAQPYWQEHIGKKEQRLAQLEKLMKEQLTAEMRAASIEESLQVHAHAYSWWAEEKAKAEALERAAGAQNDPLQGQTRAKP